MWEVHTYHIMGVEVEDNLQSSLPPITMFVQGIQFRPLGLVVSSPIDEKNPTSSNSKNLEIQLCFLM